MNKNNRLGRGLSSIFQGKSKEQIKKNSIEYINPSLIKTNPFQPRKKFSKKALDQLIDSIKTYGLIQPITVRKNKDDNYELISGERRLRAIISLGMKQIPVFIKDVEHNQIRAIALVENIQREELDPIEIALSLEHLINDYNLTHDTLGKKIGKNRSTITNYIRLLKLDPLIQAGIKDNMITMGHAKAITAIDNKKVQLEFYHDIIKNRLSVRETEIIIQKKKIRLVKETRSTKTLSNYHSQIEENLSIFFNEKIKLKMRKNGQGTIEIPFKSEKKLNEIIQLLQSS